MRCPYETSYVNKAYHPAGHTPETRRLQPIIFDSCPPSVPGTFSAAFHNIRGMCTLIAYVSRLFLLFLCSCGFCRFYFFAVVGILCFVL